MTFLIYCGDKTCAFNNRGKCRNFKIALNEQGTCMGYSPLIMPKIDMGSNDIKKIVEIEGDNNNNFPIGFSG